MSSSAYGELLALTAIRRQALAGLIAQITQGAGSVGTILVIRGHGGSLPVAGAVVGAISVAAGLARPVQGWLIDRRGSRTLMASCGLIHPAALIGIVGLAQLGAPSATLILVGAIAGLTLPPVSQSMRKVWGSVVPVSERTAAYSLVYLVQELAVLGGPLLLSAVIALANPSLALIVVAAVAASGAIWFALLAPVGAEPPVPHPRQARSVLRAPGLRVLVGLAALTGGVIGALEVGAPTIASAHHARAASGLLIAAIAVGGIAGAVVYGGRRWTAAPDRRLFVLLAALTGALAATIPVSNLVVLAIVLLLAGFVLNPALTTISVLVDHHITPSAAAEAFGWLSFGIAGGTGAASALAGALTHPSHPATAFVVSACIAATATGLCAAAVRVLRTASVAEGAA